MTKIVFKKINMLKLNFILPNITNKMSTNINLLSNKDIVYNNFLNKLKVDNIQISYYSSLRDENS